VEGFRGGIHWGPVLVGAIGIIFGLILLASPVLGAVVLPLVVGIVGVVGGIAVIIISFQMRKAAKSREVRMAGS
jgi:uncharacterized membrane protein HdeD (DUF308 family)